MTVGPTKRKPRFEVLAECLGFGGSRRDLASSFPAVQFLLSTHHATGVRVRELPVKIENLIVSGLYATESAMNEMAERLKMDPVQFRILNEPKIDESLKLPFSSRHYVECLTLGAERFEWLKRNPVVGSMKRDGLTLGWGVELGKRDAALRVSSRSQNLQTLPEP